ncbi:RNA-directed DNA polymerase, eukaryota [Tanacetum coccineum]
MKAFSDIVIKYMGEQRVAWLLKATTNSRLDGRIARVEAGVLARSRVVVFCIITMWFEVVVGGRLGIIKVGSGCQDEYESEIDNSMDEEGEVERTESRVKEKQALWDFLRFEVDKWNGDVIIMGDFNEVRVKSDRFGTHFNPHGAHRFNSFILDSGLVEVNLGGCRFTWCHRSATKMSKLDRFLVSESVLVGSPNNLKIVNSGEMDGFNTFVENTWKNSPMVGNNALLSLMNKLRNLKNQIRIWNKSNSGTRKNDQLRLKKQLEEIDLDIDRGLGNEELVNSRLAILHQIQKIDNLESKERAQKAKNYNGGGYVDWSIGLKPECIVKKEYLRHILPIVLFSLTSRGGLGTHSSEELAKVINPVVLTQSPDSWSWTLNNSGGYTVASSRNMIDSRLLPKGDLKTRWIRYVPNKVNTFAWKVMTNSLPTRFNISRRGIDIESLSCVNCDVGIETNDHLFFACNTAKKISKLINRWWWWGVPFMGD